MSITITQVRNAQSLQADNLSMDVEINHPQFGWIPYTLNSADTDTTIDNDQIMSLIGTEFLAYVAPTTEEINVALAAQVRAERNERLAATDWRASQDVTMSTSWRDYRQALRDIPQQTGFPNDVTWPIEPN